LYEGRQHRRTRKLDVTQLVVNPAILEAIAPFSALQEHELAALFPAVQHRWYARRADIVRAGDGASGLYVLLSGSAKFLMEDAEGRQVTLAVLGAGEFFSELELAGAASDGLSVAALEPCEILHVGGRDFRACIEGSVEVARLLLEKLAVRLRQAHSQIANFAFLGVRERVAQTLLECASPLDGSWTVDEGSEEIARRVGASREMVSRVLKQMGEEGLIRRQKRRTTLLDRERLSA